MPRKKEFIEFKKVVLPIRLDASKINQFFSQCPVKFLFKNYSTLELKENTWPNTVFGSTLHKIVERTFIDFNKGLDFKKTVKRSEEFEETYKKYIDRFKDSFKESRYYDEEEFLSLGKKYSESIIKFIYHHFDFEKIRIINPELKLTFKYDFVEDIETTGKLDSVINYIDNSYDIYDLKTTSKNEQYLFVDWNASVQGLMYEYFTFRYYTHFANSFNYLVVNKEEKMIFLKSKIIIAPETIEEVEQYFSPLTTAIKRIKKFLLLPLKKQIKFKVNTYNICKYCVYKKHCKDLGE